MKILLAVDGSKFSEAALQFVCSQNRPEHTTVRVVHILEPLAAVLPSTGVEPGYYPLVPADWEQFQKEQLERAQGLVAKAAEQLRSAGYQADTLVREGVTRTEIVDMAADWNADLIVLGSHGRRGLERLLLGSVSDFVSRHAKCSVQIIRTSS
jgi:nucleotide-binding universal stress UspA family protein